MLAIVCIVEFVLNVLMMLAKPLQNFVKRYKDVSDVSEDAAPNEEREERGKELRTNWSDEQQVVNYALAPIRSTVSQQSIADASGGWYSWQREELSDKHGDMTNPVLFHSASGSRSHHDPDRSRRIVGGIYW